MSQIEKKFQQPDESSSLPEDTEAARVLIQKVEVRIKRLTKQAYDLAVQIGFEGEFYPISDLTNPKAELHQTWLDLQETWGEYNRMAAYYQAHPELKLHSAWKLGPPLRKLPITQKGRSDD